MPNKSKISPLGPDSITPEFILARLWAKRGDIQDMVVLYTDAGTGRSKMIRTPSGLKTLCLLKEIFAWDILEYIADMEGL